MRTTTRKPIKAPSDKIRRGITLRFELQMSYTARLRIPNGRVQMPEASRELGGNPPSHCANKVPRDGVESPVRQELDATVAKTAGIVPNPQLDRHRLIWP